MKKSLTAFLSVIACVAALAFTMSLVACSSSETDKKSAENKVETGKTATPAGEPPKAGSAGQDDFIVSVNG